MKTPIRKQVVILLAVFVALAVLFGLATGERDVQSGRYRIGLAPFFRVDVAPTRSWMVPSGVNVVGDRGVGPAGNLVEFPVFPGYRMGIRYFSQRWCKELHAN